MYWQRVYKIEKTIHPDDLQTIADYFDHDYMNNPDPRRLQHCVLFYFIYFFCRRGRENLYEMTLDNFELATEPDGTQYVYQKMDEQDKNHGVKDKEESNVGRMYEIKGMYDFI